MKSGELAACLLLFVNVAGGEYMTEEEWQLQRHEFCNQPNDGLVFVVMQCLRSYFVDVQTYSCTRQLSND